MGKVSTGTVVAESKDALRDNLIALNFEIISVNQLNFAEVKLLDFKRKFLKIGRAHV